MRNESDITNSKVILPKIIYRNINGGSRVRWSKPEDLEAGIRQADHVREVYDPKTGKEVEKTKLVISLVRDLSVHMQKEILFPLDIQLMAEKSANTLMQAGFIDAQKERRQEVVAKILKAASLDSQHRVNSPRSRLILSHAWVDLIRELLVSKMTENKYASIGAKLIREREFERFLLSQVASHIGLLTQPGNSFEAARNIAELKFFVRQYLSKDIMRLKPYASLAATSRFLILNTGTQDELNTLRNYIGDKADMYYGTPPFTQLSFGDQTKRLGGIKKNIEQSLDIGELFLYTKTSERANALEGYYNEKK